MKRPSLSRSARARRCLSALLALALPLTLGVTAAGINSPGAAAVEGETWTDDFSGAALHPEWSIVNEDASAWSQSGGKLNVTGLPGDTYQGNNSAKNIFMVDIPAGDFTAQVTVNAPVSKVFQGAGLIAWKDIDNYVRSGLTYVGSLTPSGIAIENDTESNAVFSAQFTDRAGSQQETLRLQRVGNVITTSYMGTLGGWVTATSTTVTFATGQVGLYSLAAQDGTNLATTFDDFTVTAAEGQSIQPQGTFTIRGADPVTHLVEADGGLALATDAPQSTLSLTAQAQDDGSILLQTADGARPVLVSDGRLVLGQSGDTPDALRLTDVGGGKLYLHTASGESYAGVNEDGALVMGDKADAVALTVVKVSTSTGSLAIDGASSGAQIADDMFGIFFEDINYAADGGLYAELVRNRSFEFNSQDNGSFTSMTGWQVVNGAGTAPQALVVNDDTRLNETNRNHFRLIADGAGDGLRSLGYDEGMPFKAGETYDGSVWARTSTAQNLTFQLQNSAGSVLGSGTVAVDGSDTWKKYDLTLTSSATTTEGRLLLTAGAASVVGIDMVSLMPRDRWTGKNGLSSLRKDLAEEIAAMKPGFLRFPGGCIVNVNSMYSYDEANNFPRARAYQWKETIGPVEKRATNANFWGYNQSYGIGYLEYFEFAEDIGAEPLPVVPALLTGCGQNRATDDEALLQRHIQDTLDLIEFANGATSTEWGKLRADLGHPEPFDLKRVGVGNEENLPDEYAENFVQFRDAIKAKYPDMVVISNSGPDDAGATFETHWENNRANNVDMVDEHYYNAPDWFLLNHNRYDSYDRNGPKVFLGEYASQGNTFWNALTEASYMTGLQRNADIVKLASYAPLLVNEHHVQWSPDAIWFDNDEKWASPNWEVQKLFGNNLGDEVVPSTFTGATTQEPITGGVFLSTWNTAAAYDNVKVSDNGTGETLFQDDFANASQWSPQRGNWALSNGEYVQSSTSTTDARSIITDAYDRDWTNYTLELDARKTAGDEGFLVGFGAQGTNDFYWWNIGGWGNTRSVLQKADGGSAFEVKALEGRSLTTGTNYKVKVVVSGDHIELYLNGALQMEYDSPAEQSVYQVVTRDKDTEDVVAKVVNTSGDTVRTQVDVSGLGVEPVGQATTLTADSLTATNTKADKNNIKPVTKQVSGLSESFSYDFAPHSVTFIRMHTKDGKAPVVGDITLSGTEVEGWYADPVTVTATATDNRKVDRIEFQVDGGEWQSKSPDNASVQVSGNGQHTVNVRAVDAAGNVGEIRPVTFGIDSETPVSNATVDESARTVTVRASDNGVGVDYIETRIGTSGDWTRYTGPLAVGDSATTVYFRATDKLGNVEEAASVTVPAKTQLIPTTTKATAKKDVKQGDPLDVDVTVTGPGPKPGAAPTGSVQAVSNGQVLVTGTLTDGRVKLKVPTGGLAVGAHALTIKYLGSTTHAPSQTTVTVTVKRGK